MNTHQKMVILILPLVAASAFVGYSMGTQASSPSQNQTPAPSKNLKIGPESIVKDQQAQAVGEITNKSAQSITIKGEDNQSMTFKLSQNLFVYPLSTDPKSPPQPSTDSALLKEGQKVQLTLQLEGEEYLVTIISQI